MKRMEIALACRNRAASERLALSEGVSSVRIDGKPRRRQDWMGIAMGRRKFDSAVRTDVAERIRQYLKDIEGTGPADRVPRYRSKRYPYETTQSVAPRYGSELPRGSQFRRVPCRDLSTSGLSFFWPQPPDFEHVVVKLGDGEAAVSLTARVVRTEPCDGAAGPGHLVGCQFTGRTSIPENPTS